MTTYKKSAKDLVAHDRAHFVWLPAPGGERSDFGVYSGSRLLRPVPTDIYSEQGLVRFSRDCLANEASYILDEVAKRI